jgi:SNF2 family DNA or RNA helicase
MHFVQRYGGWRGSKPKNLHELHQRTQDLVIRRLKKDVQKELPPKQRNDLFIELEHSETLEYTKLLDELFKKWKNRGKPTLAEMPKIQQFLSEKKMPRIREMIDELLSEDRSILIFSTYIEPLKNLFKHYPSEAVLVTGQNPKERQSHIDLLSSGQKKIGLFSIGVGSMGIDSLQHKIDTVLFIDRWWVPAIHEQAEDRLHRLGQKNPVQVFYLTCTNTIDEYMRSILDEKLHVSEMITDGKLISAGTITKSFFKEFAQLLQSKFTDQTKTLDLSAIDDSELEKLPV